MFNEDSKYFGVLTLDEPERIETPKLATEMARLAIESPWANLISAVDLATAEYDLLTAESLKQYILIDALLTPTIQGTIGPDGIFTPITFIQELD